MSEMELILQILYVISYSSVSQWSGHITDIVCSIIFLSGQVILLILYVISYSSVVGSYYQKINKSGPGFPTSYVMVFFVFSELVIVRFVDIDDFFAITV